MKALAALLRTHRETILARWVSLADAHTSTGELAEHAKRDHIPQLLDAMADAIERGDATSSALDELPAIHASERWAQDFELAEIVTEYRLLRRVVLQVYAEAHGIDVPALPAIVLNENFDRAICAAASHFDRQKQIARERFADILSHDLRNPLNTISINADILLLMSDELSHAALRSASQIRSNASRMARLIQDLLDTARTRSGARLPVAPTRVDLRALLDEIRGDLVAQHPGRHLQFRVHDAGSFEGSWDRDRLHQLFTNLIGNALVHGGDPVDIELTDEGERLAVTVANAGTLHAGMGAQLFTPLHASGPTKGTGLGLYIAREIARAHGGTVTLAPVTPGRVAFRVELPRHPTATN